MKRYSELNPLDKHTEMRSHTRKKVKGDFPPSSRFMDSSDNEDVRFNKTSDYNDRMMKIMMISLSKASLC